MEEHGIEVIPIPFDLDGVTHGGGYWQEVSAENFYNSLKNGSVAKTTQINPEGFSGIFMDYAKQNKELLVILLSSGLSGTYQSSVIALAEAKEQFPECQVYTVDSISASIGVGMLVMMAVELRERGMSAGDAAQEIERRKHNVIGLFTVDDLMFLHRGGRLSKLSAVAGSVLGIKPVLNLAPDGTLALKDKTRGRKSAIEMLVSQLKRSIDEGAILDLVTIVHTNCEDDAAILEELVRKDVKVTKVISMMMGPIIGAHVGPGVLALLFETNITRTEYEKLFY
jgi:DegV family protein with EDD domain